MTNEQERKLKTMAADCAQRDYSSATIGGTMGYAGPEGAWRVPLQERVSNQLRRAVQESGKAQRLAELQQLLERNPEVARILDLIEEVRD